MSEMHLCIAVVVKDDNKAALLVALDRRDKDYYACDAGCVDPPARLSTQYKQGCNSIDTFFVPESVPEPVPRHVTGFQTYPQLCSSLCF